MTNVQQLGPLNENQSWNDELFYSILGMWHAMLALIPTERESTAWGVTFLQQKKCRTAWECAVRSPNLAHLATHVTRAFKSCMYTQLTQCWAKTEESENREMCILTVRKYTSHYNKIHVFYTVTNKSKWFNNHFEIRQKRKKSMKPWYTLNTQQNKQPDAPSTAFLESSSKAQWI